MTTRVLWPGRDVGRRRRWAEADQQAGIDITRIVIALVYGLLRVPCECTVLLVQDEAVMVAASFVIHSACLSPSLHRGTAGLCELATGNNFLLNPVPQISLRTTIYTKSGIYFLLNLVFALIFSCRRASRGRGGRGANKGSHRPVFLVGRRKRKVEEGLTSRGHREERVGGRVGRWACHGG